MKLAVVTADGDTVIRFCADDADVLAEISLLSRRVIAGRAALALAPAPQGARLLALAEAAAAAAAAPAAEAAEAAEAAAEAAPEAAPQALGEPGLAEGADALPDGLLDTLAHAAAPGAEVARVVVSLGEHMPLLKPAETPRCTNLCGKMAHYANSGIYKDGVRPYVRRTRSLFGAFTCVYTKHANFHTGSARSSTLFRGGTSTERIKHAIAHIFAESVVHSVLVHNCVFTGNLGVPVSRSNGAVQRGLEAAFGCQAQPLMAIDEQMFAVSLLLKDFRAPLVEVAPGDCPVASVRINICRTGVLNIFMAAPGGVDARTHLDETLLPVAHRLFAVIARVV